jgi:diguanylate cyclase
MKSDSDWREKYLDAIDKLESLEKDWKSLDSVFRTLTSRLCLAAQGRDDRLDGELKRVNERVRKQAEAVELLELIDPLSQAIAALDQGPAPVPSVTSTQTSIKFTPAPPAIPPPNSPLAGTPSSAPPSAAPAALSTTASPNAAPTTPPPYAATDSRSAMPSNTAPAAATERTTSAAPATPLQSIGARGDSTSIDSVMTGAAPTDLPSMSAVRSNTISEALPAQPASNPENSQRVRSAAVAATLRSLSSLPELAPALNPLHEKPPSQVSADELATALQNLTSILGEQRSRLQKEKLEVEGLLTQLNARLTEIAAHLAGDVDREQSALDSSKQLDSLVMSEMLEMTTTVQRASDLGALRKEVSGRLDAIGAHFKAFRAREEERHQAQIVRAERMRARISELERESHVLQETLKQEQRTALIDALTGIPNRAAYDDRVDKDFRSWRATNVPICILAWDIDRFKTINDQFGHKAGDKVLRVIGQFLAQQVRGTDFVGRYGGEEFVMILVETTIEQAAVVAEKIRAGVAALGFHFKNSPVTVTASCGITAFREGDSIDLAFNRADQALYRAKGEGRNRCVTD